MHVVRVGVTGCADVHSPGAAPAYSTSIPDGLMRSRDARGAVIELSGNALLEESAKQVN